MSRMRATILAIEDLMETERAKILVADFLAASKIAVRKEKLLQELAKHDIPHGAILARLAEKANANQRLLAASMLGVKAASSRLELLLNGGKSLKTYDKTGFQHSLGTPNTSTMEKRA